MSIIETGQWYNFKTILLNSSVQEFELKVILNYLTKVDILQFNKEKKIFRLNPNIVGLINRLQDN